LFEWIGGTLEATKFYQNKKERVKSIEHALRILNNAAEDSAQEIQSMVNKDYKRLKRLINDINPEVKSALQEVKEVATESISQEKEKAIETTRKSNGCYKSS